MVIEIVKEQLEAKSIFVPDRMSVIMFYGPTCGPCKATLPHYELASDFYASLNAKMDCYKINAWEPQEQAEYCKTVWEINGVPHFKIFYNENEIHKKNGGGDLMEMKKLIHIGIDECFKLYGARI